MRYDWRDLSAGEPQLLVGQPVVGPGARVQAAVLALRAGERPLPPGELSPGRRTARAQHLPVRAAPAAAVDGDDELVGHGCGVLVEARPHLEPRELAAEAAPDRAGADAAQRNACGGGAAVSGRGREGMICSSWSDSGRQEY